MYIPTKYYGYRVFKVAETIYYLDEFTIYSFSFQIGLRASVQTVPLDNIEVFTFN